MKRFLLAPVLIAALVSCKPATETTTPQEQNDSTVVQDTTPQDPQVHIAFSSEDAESYFKNLFKDPLEAGLKLDSTTAGHVTTYSISIYEGEKGLIPIDSTTFTEIDIVDTTMKWDSNASMRLLTTLPLSSIQLSEMKTYGDSLYSIESIGENTYHVSSSDSSFNAINYVSEIHALAAKAPQLVKALMGEIDGLQSYVDGTSPTIAGIAPISPSKLGIKTAFPFTPSLSELQLILPGSSAGYQIARNEKGFDLSAGTYQANEPHLGSMTIENAVNNDPIISLSTGSYDGAVLYRKSDLRVVTNRLTSMKINPVDTLAVFAVISMREKVDEPQLANSLVPGQILKSLPFEAIISQQLLESEIPLNAMTPMQTEQLGEEIAILSNQANSIESTIALNAAAQLNAANIESKAHIVNSAEFGKRALSNEYTMMIVSLPKSILKKENASQLLKTLYGEATLRPLLNVPLFLAADTSYTLLGDNLSSLVKLK